MLEQFLLQAIFLSQMAFKTPAIAMPALPSLAGVQTKIAAPEKKSVFVAPVLEAESALAYDLNSNTVLFKKKTNVHRRMASIAKLMTAMIILDSHQFSERVIITKTMTKTEPVKIWLLQGEEITVENLLFSLLINSANDAALSLALYDSLSEEKFVAKMNEKAKILGLRNTHFSNATGLDSVDNFSTAEDILRLSLASLEYDFIRRAVKTPSMEVRSTNGRIRHKLETTNDLLKTNNGFSIHGLKTGSTLGAGPSLVTLASNGHGNGSKREILTIILDSPNRFQETKVLLDWVFRAYEFP